MIRRIASRLGTGSDPGWPRHTGHVWVLGSSPNVLRQPQNILVRVLSSTWHSRPITVSHSPIAPSIAAAARTLMPMSATATRSSSPSTLATWSRLGTMYWVWGTTYLAIEKVNETMPTLLGAGVRFVVAGGALTAWTWQRMGPDEPRPTARQWRSAAIVGLLLALGGNGFVAIAEDRTVPTGVVALVIALVPLWIALIDRVVLSSGAIGWRTTVGLVGGFGGAALLVGGSIAGSVDALGLAFAVTASLSWASGSLYTRHADLPARALLGSGMQMLCGGGAMLILGAATGELADLRPSSFSLDSWLGMGYLIVFGSWLGFSTYIWLLRNVRTSLVSTYAYVNPVVAVFLGWLVLDEGITSRVVVGGITTLASVALIVSAGRDARATPSGVPEEEETAPIVEP